MTNIKRDIVNKVLSLLYCYNIVCFQDDNIKGWKDGHFSKSVHYSAVGTIKRRLSDSSALNMIEMVGLDRPEVKPVEWWIAARILGSNPCILVSLLQ